MKRAIRIAPLAALAFALPAAQVFAQDAPRTFFFRDGDRAMILGDSITEQKQYSTLIESYVLSRYPAWKINFRNTGWSGDTAGLRTRGGLDAGFARDLAPLKPTAVTIDFGMNDARAGDAGYQPYVDNSRKLAAKFKEIGTRVALVAPSSEEKYDAGFPAGSAYNNMLLKYADGLQGVAAESGLLFVDQLRPMIETIEAGRRGKALADAAGGARLIPDAVHPNWGGQLVMATHILKGLGGTPLVSRVEIDAKNTTNYTVKAENAKVTPRPLAVRPAPGTEATAPLEFERLDGALPWPIAIGNDIATALKIPGFNPLQDLSRYELKISNLTAPKYEVKCDNVVVGTYTKEELAAGVNLSNAPGPVNDQAQALLKKIMEKNNNFHNRWRNVQIFQIPAWLQSPAAEAARATEVARLDALVADAEKEIDTLRQPVKHVWTVTPVAA